jgi:hypothetical protein
MPSLPDIPGRGLVEETTKRVRLLAGGVGGGISAVGGFLLKRVSHGDGPKRRVNGEPLAETPTVASGAERKATSAPKAAKPKAARSKSTKPKAGARKAAKAAPKPKAGAAGKPPKTTGTDAPPKPEFEPGNISGDKEPHHVLNNPVVDPDETEYPDPFEKREDPRDPVDPDGRPFGEEPHAPTGAVSTSEPRPKQDIEAGDRAEPPKRENLDE